MEYAAVAGNLVVLLAVLIQMRRDGKHHDSLDRRLSAMDNRLSVVETDIGWLKKNGRQ